MLVTGMSGAGKTTLLDELSRRGHRTVDTDYDGWTSPDGTWDEARNPYGKTAGQRAEIERHLAEVEPLLRRGATLELDGRRPVAELADAVEKLLTSGR
ncbi:hypothetical protein ACIBSW_10170 [Actinoplanes sp. NPDC049668]|uniref:hypothetical protein n=1 Tax=unclassified Actinoplanes TaxID=2626549 RepID=UPI0033B04C58